VAVIVTLPAPTAVTVPDADTVATPVMLDDQVGLTVDVLPSPAVGAKFREFAARRGGRLNLP